MPELLDSTPEVSEPSEDADLFGYDDDMFDESASDADDFEVEITYDLADPER